MRRPDSLVHGRRLRGMPPPGRSTHLQRRAGGNPLPQDGLPQTAMRHGGRWRTVKEAKEDKD